MLLAVCIRLRGEPSERVEFIEARRLKFKISLRAADWPRVHKGGKEARCALAISNAQAQPAYLPVGQVAR